MIEFDVCIYSKYREITKNRTFSAESCFGVVIIILSYDIPFSNNILIIVHIFGTCVSRSSTRANIN